MAVGLWLVVQTEETETEGTGMGKMTARVASAKAAVVRSQPLEIEMAGIEDGYQLK